MTVLVGNLGAEIETGGKSGLRPSAPHLVSKGGTNWLAQSAGNLGTGLITQAPNLRSSWQAVFEAWRGVSRGTNSINNLQEETGTTTEANPAGSVQTPNKLQTAFLPALTAHSQRAGSKAQTNATGAAQIATNRLQPKSGQDAIDLSETTTASGQTGLPDAYRSRRTNSRSPQQNTAALPAKANSEARTSPTIETAYLSVPMVSVPATAAAIAQARIPMAAVPQAEAGEMPPASESNSVLQGLRSTPILRAPEFAHQETGAMHTGWANSGAQKQPADAVSLADGATRGLTARGASPPSLDDLSEPAAVHSRLAGELPALDAQRESKAATDGNSAGHSGSPTRTANLTNSEISMSGKASAASHASSPGTEKTTADATQNISSGHSAQDVQEHNAAREPGTAAAQAVATQPATLDVTSATLRTPAAPHAAQPSAGAAPMASASSPTSAQDTFVALDRETALGPPTWTHAAGQHAEAGFRDPDLGWVGVRADLNASGIHATLVPSSSDAAQTLGSHLAGLSLHLADEHAPVASLSLASPGETGADGGAGQRMEQGTEDNAPGNQPDRSAATSQKSAAESSMSTLAATAESGFSSETRGYPGDLRGTHISVIA